ncbi:hypothetical protein A3Q56_07859 [Intoshia linei]|uniref:G-protein coupled receptors family 1 profile domain-containing protein n=1 Tax=Intoshia linei TaxID=1819745 RepID=A0A177ASR5_9BILA|nr:hypothetical protein A3Q56_07859 [Intoshia linei]
MPLSNSTQSDIPFEFFYKLYGISAPVLIIIVIIIGSILSVISIIINYKIIKRMRYYQSYFYLSISASYLILIIFCLPFVAYQYANNGWIFGNYYCKFVGYIRAFVFTLVPYLLLALSVYRYLFIVQSEFMLNLELPKFIKKLLVFMAVIASIINLANFQVFRINKAISVDELDYCLIDNQSMGRLVTAIYFILGFTFPLTCCFVVQFISIYKMESFRNVILEREGYDLRKSNCFKNTIITMILTICFLVMVGPLVAHLFQNYFGFFIFGKPWLIYSVFAYVLSYFVVIVHTVIFFFTNNYFKILCNKVNQVQYTEMQSNESYFNMTCESLKL